MSIGLGNDTSRPPEQPMSLTRRHLRHPRRRLPLKLGVPEVYSFRSHLGANLAGFFIIEFGSLSFAQEFEDHGSPNFSVSYSVN